MDPAAPTPPVPPAPGSPGAVPPPPAPHEPTIVEVEVVASGPRVVEVRLADGRPGVIARTDFEPDGPPAVGDRIEAAALARDDPEGRVVLSHAWARKHRGWTAVLDARRDHRPVRGSVRRAVKGGLVVEVEGLRAFLPASLVDDGPVDVEAVVGEDLELTVVEADRATDRLVVSRRDLVRRERRRRHKELLGSLEPGQRVSGEVVDVLEYGARVDLGDGVVGLVHRSELAWGRFGAVADVLSVGQQVEVVVIDVQRAKRRVALSLRRLTADPLGELSVGQVVDARITRVVDFGAFARLEGSGAEGLIHISELSDLPGSRPEELVVPGDVVRVKVIEVDRTRHRLGLSVTRALLA